MKPFIFTVRPLAEVLSPARISGDGSLVDQLYAALRLAIINLSLPPELALVEQDVAAALGVSKTPVREAIIRLEREGLVRVVPKSGSYVTPISLERYLEACFVRIQLETGCVRRLTMHGISLEGQIKLRAYIAEQEAALRANDDTMFFQSDEAMHRCMFELANLAGAWRVMNFAKAELDRVRHLKRQFGIRQRHLVIKEHRVLIEAIIARDVKAAEQALLDNIGAVDDEIISISQHPALLRTIEDLNTLVALDHRRRGRSGVRKAS